MTQPVEMSPEEVQQFFEGRARSAHAEDAITGMFMIAAATIVIMIVYAMIPPGDDVGRPLYADEIDSHGEYQVQDPDTLETLYLPGDMARAIKRIHPEAVVTRD